MNNTLEIEAGSGTSSDSETTSNQNEGFWATLASVFSFLSSSEKNINITLNEPLTKREAINSGLRAIDHTKEVFFRKRV